MYFNGLIQDFGAVPRYLLNALGDVPDEEYVRSERAFLCRDNWLCPDRKLLSIAPAVHRQAVQVSHWIGSQHWPCLKNMVPRRFALVRADGAYPDQFGEQFIDHVGEKIHIPLFGRTVVGHPELGNAELALFRGYRFNDRFPMTIATKGNEPAVHLVFMFTQASIAYFKSAAQLSAIKEPTEGEAIRPGNLIYLPV